MLLTLMEEESVKNIMKMNKKIDNLIEGLEMSRKLCLEIAEECICFINNNLSLWKIYQTNDKSIYFAFISSIDGLASVIVFKYTSDKFKRLSLLMSSIIMPDKLNDYLMRLDEFMPNLLYFKDQEYKFIDVCLSDKKSEIVVFSSKDNKSTYYEYNFKKNKFAKLNTEHGYISFSSYPICSGGYDEEDHSSYDEEKLKYYYPDSGLLNKLSEYIDKYKKLI